MLAKRIIPCLDIKNGRTVKGINFVDLIDAGDPVEQAQFYSENGADELVFLDITATKEKRKTFAGLVERIAQKISIPFTVGGGISTLEDVQILLQSGADKVSVNSSAVKNPALIDELSAKFGSQCVVVAIDAKELEGKWKVHLVGGRVPTEIDLFNWAREAEKTWGRGDSFYVHEPRRNQTRFCQSGFSQTQRSAQHSGYCFGRSRKNAGFCRYFYQRKS